MRFHSFTVKLIGRVSFPAFASATPLVFASVPLADFGVLDPAEVFP